jgi:uncharacterized protein YqhQ
MRGPHYWAWATEGRNVASAPVHTLLSRSRLARIPIVRSLVALAEMIAFMLLLYSRNGLRRSARFVAFLAAALACDWVLSMFVPVLIHDAFLADVLVALVAFAMGILAMRLGLGNSVWRYHGAEHKAVNAYEGGADLRDLGEVARYSRVHDRCGTNLAVIALLVTLVSYFALQSLPFVLGGICSLLVIAVSLEFFRLIARRPTSRASRVLLAGGKALQRSVTTSEPAPEHLALACAALRRVLDLETGLG